MTEKTKEQVKKEMKDRAEDAKIIEEQPKKKSFGRKIFDGICWAGKKAWQHKSEIITGAVTVIVTKTICDKKSEKKVEEAWNSGCTDGVVASRVEHSPLTEEEKNNFFESKGWNRQSYKNDEKVGVAIVEGIKSLRK